LAPVSRSPRHDVVFIPAATEFSAGTSSVTDSIDTLNNSPPGYLGRDDLPCVVRLAPLVSIKLVATGCLERVKMLAGIPVYQ
jgi:hypothetical protein